MFTKDSRILNHRLTVPLTAVANAVGDVFKPITFNQIIKSLFANNEQGFVYDPNDLSTMFQDAAGTVPVTGAGQPVGLILDKSGRNNHARQTNSAMRPILRQNVVTGAYYLEFDGVDDFLATNSIDFTSTDKISLFTGVSKLSDRSQVIAAATAEQADLVEGAFYLTSGYSDLGNGYSSFSRGTAEPTLYLIASIVTYPSPDDAVLSVNHDISNSLSSIRRNGVVGVDAIGDKGVGNFSNLPLHIGTLGAVGMYFFGHIYSLIGVGKLATASETAAIEKELAKRTGVTLS